MSTASIPASATLTADQIRSGGLPVFAGGTSRTAPAKTADEKAWTQAQDFEAMFLNQMMQTMFTGVGEDGPLGSGPGTGMWRSFLIDEYAKSTVKAGGIGIAKQVYAQLLNQQEAAAAARSAGAATASYAATLDAPSTIQTITNTKGSVQ
jgi:Rod binding domain-containing protein